MRKVIFIICSVLLLSSCGKQDIFDDEKANDSTNLSDEELLHDYVREVFSEYGYEAPDESKWIIKYEGSMKVVVIIKEYGIKTTINKLIFLWDGSKTDAQILEVVINNRSVYSGK